MKLYYKDSNCSITQGDCLEVMTKMAEKGLKFDAIITDPPYGTTACKWDTIIPFDKMWACLNNLRKESTPIILFGSEPFSSLLRCSNLKEFKYDWVWNKKKGGNIMNLKHQPYKIHEIVSVFNKHNYYPIMEDQKERTGKTYSKGEANGIPNYGDERIYNQKYPKSIVEISNANQNGKAHPTQKPVELMEYLIKTYTNESDIILDFTCGSGTTLVASKKLNRKCYGIELEEKYCEVAKNRLIELDTQ